MTAQKSQKTYTISNLANLLQVSPHVIRRWEKDYSIKTHRSAIGHRVYFERDLNKFKTIQNRLNSNEKLLNKSKPETRFTTGSITNLSEILQVSKHVIRRWEKKYDIKTHRDSKGHRVYTQKDLNKFKAIQSLLNTKENILKRGAKKRQPSTLRLIPAATLAAATLVLIFSTLTAQDISDKMNAALEFLANSQEKEVLPATVAEPAAVAPTQTPNEPTATLSDPLQNIIDINYPYFLDEILLSNTIVTDNRGIIYPNGGDNQSLGSDEHPWRSIFAKDFTLDEHGNVHIGGLAYFDDEAKFEEKVHVEGDLFVGGDVNFVGENVTIGNSSEHTLTVVSTPVFEQDAAFKGSLTIDKNLTVTGTTNITGVLSTGFSEGSVAFSNSSGNLTEDNTNFYWDDTNNRLGLGATPSTTLHVAGTALFQNTSNSTTAYQFLDADGGTPIVNIDTTNEWVGIGTATPGKLFHMVNSTTRQAFYAGSELAIERYSDNANSDVFTLRKARGTIASPTAVADDDELGQLLWSGHDGTSFFYVGAIGMEIDGATGTGNLPTRMIFQTTPDGSATPATRLTILNDGNVGIGTTTPEAKIHITDTSSSNSLVAIGKYSGNRGDIFFYDDDRSGTQRVMFGITVDAATDKRVFFSSVTGESQARFGFTGNGAMEWGNGAGSADTNLFRDSANKLRTNDTLIVDGNVGIGNTSPTAKLMIDGSADDEQFIVQAHSSQTANILEIQDSSNNVLSGVDERGILFSDGNIDVDSVFIGKDAGRTAASGAVSNIGIGSGSLASLTSGDNNFGIGELALNALTTGSSNTVLGSNSTKTLSTGSQNVGIGTSTLRDNNNSFNTAIGSVALLTSTGTQNVGIGNSAGGSNVAGDRNIFLGYSAGWRQTAVSDLLIVDNRTRADIATELTNSILYGVMAASPTDQTLRINGELNVMSGSVGIGTTSPAHELDVLGSIRLGDDTSSNNELNTSTGTATTADLYWGDDLLCDVSEANCGIGAAGLFTDGGTVTYLTSLTDDIAIGGTDLANSIFSIDESTATFLFGGDQSADPTLRFEATGSETADFGFNPLDSFFFTGANIGIGMTAPASLLHLQGTVNDIPLITLETTGTGHGGVFGIKFDNDSSSPASLDNIGTLDFYGNDSGLSKTNYAQIQAEISDTTGADEAGRIILRTMVNATLRDFLTIEGAAFGTVERGEVVVNESGVNIIDFRVEGAGTNGLIFADSGTNFVGIGTTSPSTRLNILSTTEQLRMNYDDSNYYSFTVADDGNLTLAGTGTDSDLTFTVPDDIIFTDNQVTAIQLSDVDTSLPNSNTGIVDAINDAYNAATGGGGGLWSDGSTLTYLTTATYDLAIGGSDLANSIFSIDESAGVFLFGGDQSADPTLRFEAADSDTADFGFNTLDSFYFTGGSVGIGTTGPSALLHVGTGGAPTIIDGTNDVYIQDDLEVDQTIYVTGGDINTTYSGGNSTWWGTDSSGGYISVETGGEFSIYTPTVAFTILETTGFTGIGDQTPDAHLEISASGGTGGSVFLVSSDDATNGDLFTILENGNVGIGTTSPADLLHVNPTTGDQGISIFESDSTSQRAVELNGWDTGGDINIYQSGNIIHQISGISGNEVVFNETGTRVDFRVESDNDPYALLLDVSTDRIGIGATTPRSRLDIVGRADETQLIVQANSSQTANILEIQDSAGNADIFVIDGSERVAIGASSTSWTLYVAGTLRVNTYIEVSSDTNVLVDDSGERLIGHDTNDLTIDPKLAGADMLFLTNQVGGNVGIGTETPTAKLTIDGDSDEIQLIVQADATQTTNLQEWQGSDGSSLGVIAADGSLGIGDSSPDGLLEVSASSGADDLFMLSSDDDANGDLFIVKNSGSVGIGTSAPGKTFEVAGDILAKGGTLFSQKTGSDGAFTVFQALNVAGNTVAQIAPNSGTGNVFFNTANAWGFSASATDLGGYVFIDGKADEQQFIVQAHSTQTSNILEVQDSSANALAVFASDGSLGIGTTSPAHELDVVGSIRLGDDTSTNNELNTTSGTATTADLYWGDDLLCDVSETDCGGGGTALFTDGGAGTYLTSLTDDLAIGGTSPNIAVFGVDEGLGTIFMGGDSVVDPEITFTSATGATGDLGYNQYDTFFFSGGNVGIGETNADYSLDIVSSDTTGVLQLTGDSVTTGTGALFSFDGLTSGTGILLESAPSTATTLSGNLLRLNVGSNLTVTGNILSIEDNGSALFTVGQSAITSAIPHSFTAPGDVSMAYDLQFTNQTSSYIKSKAPLYIEAGESFENNNLSLKTYGTGNVYFDLSGTGNLQAEGTDTSFIFNTTTATDTDYWIGVIDDAGNDDDDIFVIGDGVTPGTNNFVAITTTGLVGIGTTGPAHELDVWGSIRLGDDTSSNNELNTSTGTATTADLYWGDDLLCDVSEATCGIGAAGLFTDGGAATYLTSLTDDLAIGGTSPNVAVFGIDEGLGTIYIGGDSVVDPQVTFTASDADTGNLGYSTYDSFYFEGGSVGIGTTAPGESLHVAGKIRVDTLNSASDIDICVDSNNVLSDCASSIRYKENLSDLNLGLATIMELDPVTFDWIGRDESSLGFIAEDVEDISPLLVSYRNGQVEGVKYKQLTAVLTNAIQEQQAQLDELQDNNTLINELLGLNDALQSSESTESTMSSTLSGVSGFVEQMLAIFNQFKEFVEALGITLDEENNSLAINSDLNVLGDTTLSNLFVAGNLHVGLVEIDQLNSAINVLGAPCYNAETNIHNKILCGSQTLRLQDGMAGNIDMFNGVVVIEPNGDITTKGNIDAKTISADEYVIGTSSQASGSSELSEGEDEIEILSGLVQNDSKIFVTPTSSTSGDTPYIKDKKEGISFTVAVDNNTTSTITFDWWILNTK